MMIELTENGKRIWINQNSITVVREPYYMPEGSTCKAQVQYGDGYTCILVDETPQEVIAKMFTALIPFIQPVITCNESKPVPMPVPNYNGGTYA